jgi:hypothetical protein
MPLIAILGSIKIYVYFNDHLPPHFHALYTEYEAMIAIEDLTLIAGKLPSKELKRVLQWARDNQSFLLKSYKECNPKYYQ